MRSVIIQRTFRLYLTKTKTKSRSSLWKTKRIHDSLSCCTTFSSSNNYLYIIGLSLPRGIFAHCWDNRFSSQKFAGMCWVIDFGSAVATSWFLILTHSVVDLLVFLGALSCWMMQFQPGFSCHQVHSWLNDCKDLWLQTSPNQQLSTTVLGSWNEVFVLICCLLQM